MLLHDRYLSLLRRICDWTGDLSGFRLARIDYRLSLSCRFNMTISSQISS